MTIRLNRRGFFLLSALKWALGTGLKAAGIVAATTKSPVWAVGTFVAGELLHALKLDQG